VRTSAHRVIHVWEKFKSSHSLEKIITGSELSYVLLQKCFPEQETQHRSYVLSSQDDEKSCKQSIDRATEELDKK
jgi:hypothetical protein